MTTTAQPLGIGVVSVRRLTAAEMKARFDQMARYFAQLESAWEASEHRDQNALRGMLVHYRPMLPEVLFTGLIEELDRRRPMHRVRYEEVAAELANNPKLTVRQACARVSAKLAKSPQRGKPGAIQRSYYMVKPKNAS